MLRRRGVIAIVTLTGVTACSAQGGAPGSSSSSLSATPVGAATTATTGAPSESMTTGGTVPSSPAQQASLAVVPADGTSDVKPDQKVTVTAEHGTLQTVEVTDGAGAAVPGAVKDGVWRATGNLAPAKRYTVKATAIGADGAAQTTTSTFSTLQPAVVATYKLLYDKTTVGVGAPVTIQFDTAVATKQMRAEIEKHAIVTTTPAVEGSWGWLDGRQLMWRPANFWAPGTKVSLAANLQGLQTGQGKWVGRSATSTFTVGPSMISTVDMRKHQMTVQRDGKVVRTIPVSTGKSDKPEFVTRSGTKVIIEKAGDITMDSESVGIMKGSPDYYKLDTKYNLRVTWTGEFLHAAPWSVGAQGSANVSHGCTNLSPENAQWMFDNSLVGDVIKFTGSNRPFVPTEGIGVWEYSYDNWKKQSALAS